MVNQHRIIKGNEKFGICGKCCMQGDLTKVSCEEGTKLRKQIEQALQATKYNWNLENFAKFWENIAYEIAQKEKLNQYDGRGCDEDCDSCIDRVNCFQDDDWADEDDDGDEPDW